MRWLKKTLARWVNDGNDILDEWNSESYGGNMLVEERNSPDCDPTMNFKVYNADGGKIVEFRQYDRASDRSTNRLYIIPEDKDFGDGIKHIAMMHLLSTQK